MALQVSGAIALSDVNVELLAAATTAIALNDATVRNLFAKPSGAIALSDGYGKSNVLLQTITTNQVNFNLRTWLVGQGWDGNQAVEVTINSGVWIYANTTGAYACTIAGSFPNGLTVRNNGNIVGMGGNGGGSASAGAAGGPALSVSTPVTIYNAGNVAGGGGGGGGGARSIRSSSGSYTPTSANVAGGSGGGGRSGLTNSSGAAAGTSGGPGGGGGRGSIVIRSTEYYAYFQTLYSGVGGSGGGWGAGGGGGGTAFVSGNTFGWSQSGTGGGGGAGACTAGNSNITWAATGSRFGALN